MVNNVKKIIKIFMVLLVICIVLLISYTLTDKYKATTNMKKVNNNEIKNYRKEEFEIPNNIESLIAEYNGNIENRIIYKNLYYFAKDLVPKYYKKLGNTSEDQIRKYYNKNKDVVYIELGIEDEETFVKFINHLSKLNGEQINFLNYSILKTSIKQKGNNNVSAYLSISFENNEDIIFSFYIESIINDERTSIIYGTDIDEEVLEEEKKLIEEKENIDDTEYIEPDNENIVKGKAL